ncbi:MAG: tetratricopeptide repeat protein [Turneriella sp.]
MIENSVSAAEIRALAFADEKPATAFLDAQLAAIENNNHKPRAKELMVKAFHLLGNENPLTLDYRRRLSRALF